MRWMSIVVVAAFSLTLISCGEEAPKPADADSPAPKKAEEKPADKTAATAAVKVEAQTLEVACGSCIYKMDGVKGCKAAVKIDSKTLMLTGGKINAHGAGLCKTAKQAVVSGEVKDGVLIATDVKLK